MQESQLYMLLGTLTAEVKALREQHQQWRTENEIDRKEALKDFKILDQKIDRVEETLEALAKWRPGVDATISQMMHEQNKLSAIVGKGMAAFALIGTIVALVSGGLWQIIIHWVDLGNAWRAFWGQK